MKLAFYAPMKPPTHPTPSGDRTMGRSLILALEHGGIDVTLASELRVYDKVGDARAQSDSAARAEDETERLIKRGSAEGWTAWLTYHNYYKAPDLLGPKVSRALGIPYLLAEATRARKRFGGPWDSFARAAEMASDAADVIFYFTEHDAEALRDRAPSHQKVLRLRPFLPVNTLPAPSDRSGGMLSVAMMRHGDKLASYRVIAEALGQLRTPGWHLDIVGDGDARDAVHDLLRAFDAQVSFHGKRNETQLHQHYSTASLLLWPGVNEAFGLTYLEAQAAGVPVIAQDRPGVRDVLAPGIYPSVQAGPRALARRIDDLLGHPKALSEAAQQARTHVKRYHLIDSATETLLNALGRTVS